MAKNFRTTWSRAIKAHRRVALIASLVALLAILELTNTTHLFHKASTPSSQPPGGSTTPTTSSGSRVDLTPGTAAQQAEADQNKTKPRTSTQASPAIKNVVPTITSAYQDGVVVKVYAYIAGIVEDGGACTIKATMGNLSLSPEPSSSAFANATTTNCTPFSVSASSFPARGTWNIAVKYQSPTATGTSQPLSIEVR